MDQIYRNTFWNTPGNPPGVVIVYDFWPQPIKDMWTNILQSSGFRPELPPYAPTYEEQHWSHQDAQVPPTALSIYDYASSETAIEMMHRFNAAQVVPVHKKYTEPPAFERWLVFADNIAVNAGRLAYCFTRNPNNEAVAHDECLQQIQERREKGYTLAQAAA